MKFLIDNFAEQILKFKIRFENHDFTDSGTSIQHYNS